MSEAEDAEMDAQIRALQQQIITVRKGDREKHDKSGYVDDDDLYARALVLSICHVSVC